MATRGMKLAKTSHEEIDQLSQVLNEIEWLSKDLRRVFVDFEDVDFSKYEILKDFPDDSPLEFLQHLVHHLSGIHWQRILWNCRTMLDNCADPDQDTLEFNPRITKALELLEQSEPQNQE